MSSCFGCCRRSRGRRACNESRQTGPSELLVLGLEGAGKSLLMRQTCNLANSLHKTIPQVQPTVGVELYKLSLHKSHRNHVIQAREVGGCMLPVWPQYFDAAHALLYVVSVNAAGLLAAAITELHTLLSHQGLQGKPVCLVLHGQNCDNHTVSPAILDHVLDMDGLQAAHAGSLTVLNVSADAAAGPQQLLSWIKQHSQQ